MTPNQGSRRRWEVSQSDVLGEVYPLLAPRSDAEIRAWPKPVKELDKVVRVLPPGWGYCVDVEIVLDDEFEPVVLGLAVRKLLAATPGKAGPEVAHNAELVPLSSRDARRLPLDQCVQIALAAVKDPLGLDGAVGQVLVPKGRPKRGGMEFYRELADAHRQFTAQGKDPVAEIARRKKVDPNTVHQWCFRARELELLEESNRSGRSRRRKR